MNPRRWPRCQRCNSRLNSWTIRICMNCQLAERTGAQ